MLKVRSRRLGLTNVCSKVYAEAAVDVRTVRQWVRQIKEGETGGATVLQDNSEVVVLELQRCFCVVTQAEVVEAYKLRSWLRRSAEMIRFYVLQLDINQFSVNYL